MAIKHYSMQLTDLITGASITTAGGKVQVCKPGTPDKATLLNKDGSAAANPLTPIRGKIDFYCDDAAAPTVDLYIQAPGGQFIQIYSVLASGLNEIEVGTTGRAQVAVIPFSIADAVAATEQATGFIIPATAMVLPNPMIRVTALEAAKTILAGTLSTASGVAAGFLTGVSLAALGLVKASNINGAQTMGSLLFGQDSVNAGDRVPEGDVTSAGKQISYTLSSGTTLAKGFISVPLVLAA